jgi:Disulphide bond corrector protein DsbC
MEFRSCCAIRYAAGLFALVSVTGLCAQTGAILAVAPPNQLVARRASKVEAKLSVTLQEGFHVNSNKPSEDYLIPLRLTWTSGPLEAGEILYPPAKMEKYAFSEKPLSVFTGNFQLTARFQAPATAPTGPATMVGRLRYQACNDRACFPPRNVEVKLPVEIR